MGLLIYQGVDSGDLNNMETGHISLTEGTVYIPAAARSNSRTLSLMPVQMLPLNQYLEEIRPQLKPIGDELFPGRTYNVVGRLMQEIQGFNTAVRNALHIRASVIMGWLKQYNKRQVQYMAGHKYITSTEAYSIQDTDTLQDELSKHHPFG